MRISYCLPLLLGSFLLGCQGGGLPSALPIELDRTTFHDAGVGEAYRLTADAPVNGQMLPKDTLVHGYRNPTAEGGGSWWIKPEFEELKGDRPFIFGKRFGAGTFVRFDYAGNPPSKEQPTPFTQVVLYHDYDSYERSPRDRWFGIVGGTNKVTLLSETGQAQATFDNVSNENLKSSIELLPADGALLVHHAGYDRLYDKTGQPISPEVSPLISIVRTKPNGHMMPDLLSKVYGFRLTAEKERYWLLQDDGRMFPKPDDCLGLQPLLALDAYNIRFWRGWLVWWKTPNGERAAYLGVEEATSSFEKLMASRTQAKWVEWTTYYNMDMSRFEDLRREKNTAGYELVCREEPLTDHLLASVEEGTKLLEKLRAEEYERSRKHLAEFEQAQARIKAEAARAAEEKRVVEAKAVVVSAQDGFDQAMKRDDRTMARFNLLKLEYDPLRWTGYVQRYGLDGAANDSFTVGYARAKLGGTYAETLEKALRAVEAKVTVQNPQSDWDYFWNGPRDGSYTGPKSNYQVDERLTPQGAMRHNEEVRQRNAEAWLRGAQNWGGPR